MHSVLSGTASDGITYAVHQCESEQLDDWIDFYGMSDADWAGCLKTRRSTAGYLVSALGGPIAWGSKVMATIATSSMESEYMAAYYLGQTIVYLRNMMDEIGLPLSRPTPFFMDAMAAIQALKNGHLSNRTKHIDVKSRWLLQLDDRGLVEYLHIRTDDMSPDLLTKIPACAAIWNALNGHISGRERRTARMLVKAQKREKGEPYPKEESK
jgi:hypothetical protein